jgi:hypothetical protein
MLAASMCLAQSGSNASQAAPGTQSGTVSPSSSSATTAQGSLEVRLAKTLHSKKLKEGDVVEASIIGGAMADAGGHVRAIPRGSKTIGRVTEAKARSNGDNVSSLGIVFEKVRFHDGQELAIRGIIYAVSVDPPPAIALPKDPYNNPTPVCSPGDLQMTNVPCAGRTPPRQEPSAKATASEVNLQFGPDGVVSSTTKEVELDLSMKIELSVTVM